VSPGHRLYAPGTFRALTPSEIAGRIGEALTSDVLTVIETSAWDGFQAALATVVDSAMYWQPPDDDDQLLADHDVAYALVPVEEAIRVATAVQWWREDVLLDDQYVVDHVIEPNTEEIEDPPTAIGIRSNLEEWRSTSLEEEAKAVKERSADPSAAWSGHWWSTPAFSGVRSSTRSIHGEPIGLTLVEDRMDWHHARTWKLEFRRSPKVFEVSGPDRYRELVSRFPMEVTASRRHDWFRAAGAMGSLLMPDWRAVADDFDGVHLTTWGYLTCAGRALAIEDAWAVMAGLCPEETYWLADDLFVAAEPARWELDPEAETWSMARQG